MSLFFKKNTAKGSVTIYLAATITLILSLVFGVIESARIISLRTRATAASYSALDSAFSDFALQPFEKYGIFCLFTSEEDFISQIENYASANTSPENLSSILSFNLLNAKVSNVSCNQLYYITDNYGKIFASQAAAYEKYRSGLNMATEFLGMKESLDKCNMVSPADISSNTITVTESDLSNIDSNHTTSSDSLYKDSSYSQASSLKDNIMSHMLKLMKSNLLLFFVGNTSTISGTELTENTIDNMPSHICPIPPDDNAGTADPDTMMDFYLFMSYINNSFGSYMSDTNSEISLKYQREYILCGNASDSDNLLSAGLYILNFRAGLNLAHILLDSEKTDAVYNVARSACMFTPIISDIAAFSIMSAWAYAEAIIDVRDLFAGKKVPLMKDDSTWTLSLSGICKLGRNFPSKNSGKEGFSYDDYLNMCLLSSEPAMLYYHAMDLIQLDMQENYNTGFLMNACLAGSDININYEISPLFTGEIKLFHPDTYNFSVNLVYGYD